MPDDKDKTPTVLDAFIPTRFQELKKKLPEHMENWKADEKKVKIPNPVGG